MSERQRITMGRKYTCGGEEVVLHAITLHNSAGHPVTYPVKGSVVMRKGRKRPKLDYRISSIYGEADVVWGTGDNLVPAEDQP